MFQWVGHQLEKDHLDLSFKNTASWTAAGPDFDIKNQWFIVGDRDTGPAIMLGNPPPMPEDMWVDTHYHASDQFRVVLKGEYLIHTHRMKAGEFGYQESGRTYREGLAAHTEDCWIFALHGTWPGARGTLVKKTGNLPVNEDSLYDNQLDRFVASADDPYWDDVAGGARGIVALRTTAGPTQAGYVWGSFDETEGWTPIGEGVTATAGLFGLEDNGPLLLTAQADANRVVVPAAACGTEVVLVVVKGSVEVGGISYEVGDMRVQKAGTTMQPVVSGAAGADVVVLIADRRERPRAIEDDASSAAWEQALDGFYGDLVGVGT